MENREKIIKGELLLPPSLILGTPLHELGLSHRPYWILKAVGIKTLGQLVQYSPHDLLKFRNFGRKSLAEVMYMLEQRGLEFLGKN